MWHSAKLSLRLPLPGTENADQPTEEIISEKSESSFAPSHSFCRCTTFWRGSLRLPARPSKPNYSRVSCALLIDRSQSISLLLSHAASNPEIFWSNFAAI